LQREYLAPLLRPKQVFNLTQLRSVANPPVIFTEIAHYSGIQGAHNIAINEQSGFAYLVGTETHSGGLHILDLSDPVNPVFVGGFSADGYTHDTQVVIYQGPDTSHVGREISFNANTDTLTIVDVTDKSSPLQISRTGYPNVRYLHQGCLTAMSTVLTLFPLTSISMTVMLLHQVRLTEWSMRGTIWSLIVSPWACFSLPSWSSRMAIFTRPALRTVSSTFRT
jgi:hypothetical protein